jgi:hypothetical protein
MGLLLIIPAVTDVAIDFNLAFGLLHAGPLLVIAYLLAALASFRDFRSWRGCILWLSPPLASVLILVAAHTDYPLLLRVRLSEESLLAHAADVNAELVDWREARWVGLFYVKETKTYEGAVFFYTRNSFLNWEGVAYIPPGVPPVPRISAQPLTGDWYRFTWRF